MPSLAALTNPIPLRPVSDLQKRFSEIEELAAEEPVRLTKNGKGAYYFLSDNTFEQLINELREELRYEATMHYVLEHGKADIAAGRYYESVDDLKKSLASNEVD